MLETADYAKATVDGEFLAHVSLVDDGFHGLGPLNRAESECFHDSGEREEPVDVSEGLGLVRGEVGREWAIIGALPPLVLARGARWLEGGCVTSEAHVFFLLLEFKRSNRKLRG